MKTKIHFVAVSIICLLAVLPVAATTITVGIEQNCLIRNHSLDTKRYESYIHGYE